MNVLVVFLIFAIVSVRCEFYSSIDKIRTVFGTEREILENFQDIASKTNDVTHFLDEKLKPWLDDSNIAKNDLDKYVTNPLNAYLLLKRNAFDAKMVTKKLLTFIEELQEKIKKIEEKTIIEEKEVIGAVGGIIRSQKAYKLKIEDLVDGIIDGVQTRVPLTPHDVFVLGSSASVDVENHFFMKGYLEIAKQKVANGDDHLKEVSVEEIDKLMQNIANNIRDPYDESYTLTTERNALTEIFLVQKACRGDLKRSQQETKNLYCSMVSHSPFSSIAPFKMEVLNTEPHIIMYHEVLSDREITHLLDLARKNQQRAVTGKLENAKAVDKSRLAQVMWLFDSLYPDETKYLNARFEDMTGLSMEVSDALQIQNYGVGGHYYAHYDAFDGGVGSMLFDESKVHRIATLMLYMANVEKGGATVFPYLKVRVEPQKGSAIFWYNIKHSGHHEPYSLHSGCPILLGSKWVANKWIYNSGQIFRKPCKPEPFLKKDDTLEMLLNFKEN